jgi:Putative Actinobacterial Holin-X, holin superfamily III
VSDPQVLQGRAAPPVQADRPIPDLMKQLADETTTLVRQELELFKTEMSEKGKRAGIGVGMLGGGGLVALYALAALTTCVIAGLSLAIPVWAAALMVAVVYGALAGFLAITGKTKVQQALPPAPEQTAETVKEDIEWAKTRAASGRK